MYLKMTKIAFILLVALSVAVISGCVTDKEFKMAISNQDEKIDTVQTGVEANERRISDLKNETKAEFTRLDGKVDGAVAKGEEALTKAQLAEKLAKGKVIFEVTLTNEAVKFGFDKSMLTDEAKAALDDLAGKIKGQNKLLYLEIQGHTDNIGSEDYNLKLGEKRAEAVRRYLSETHAIPLPMMSVISYGEGMAIADNKTKDGRALNRRVVVRVLE
jgi:outer membrane protein OmpA-like peptidoglycan-associated protein